MPLLYFKGLIKLKKKKFCLLFNICVNCAIRRIKVMSSIVNQIFVVMRNKNKNRWG